MGRGGIKANNIANKISILLPGIPVYGAENEIARNTLFVLSINDDFNRRNLKLEYMIDIPTNQIKYINFITLVNKLKKYTIITLIQNYE